MEEVEISYQELLDVYRRLEDPKGDRDSVLAAMRAAVQESEKKTSIHIENLDSLLFDSLLAMQCALIEVNQGGDPKKAIQNWIGPVVSQYGNDLGEHYTKVNISADEYYKQRQEIGND